MTVLDLLRHTAGFTYGFHNRTPIDAAYRNMRIAEMDTEGGLPAMIAQLESLRYTVLAAASAPEALDIVASGRAFDLLFSDVILGSGVNGPGLADEDRAPGPEPSGGAALRERVKDFHSHIVRPRNKVASPLQSRS